MALIIRGNVFVGNRLDGINLGGTDKGNGCSISGVESVEITENVVANNGRNGISVFAADTWMRDNGFPEDTNPQELAELLNAVRAVPEEHRQETVESSGLFQRWAARGTNAVALCANIVTIAGSGDVGRLIKSLLGNP
jgi:hypothetical protein